MAITRSVSLTDNAYQAITSIKGSLSYSETILKLVTEHHELAKQQLNSMRVIPEAL